MSNLNYEDLLYQKARSIHKQYQGKITIKNLVNVNDKNTLSLLYSPGVASVCLDIVNDPQKVYEYTLKKRIIAVVSDGSAVLGLGNIGPKAALPVMEGKCLLFNAFAGVEAFPICLDTQDPEEIIKVCKIIAPSFGGINLEDISAPRCIEILQRLKEELDIPVFHDDQEGTAIVVTAAVLNIIRLKKLNINSIQIALSGTGAAGSCIAKYLKKIGIPKIYAYNKSGIVSKKKYHQYDSLIKSLLDQQIIDSYDDLSTDNLSSIMRGATIFIGVSIENILTHQMVELMDRKIILALANPNPEISFEELSKTSYELYATGRSDFPNQINNVLAFPGLFKGILTSGIKKISDDIIFIAINALSKYIADDQLNDNYILPNPLDKRVSEHISNAIVSYVKTNTESGG